MVPALLFLPAFLLCWLLGSTAQSSEPARPLTVYVAGTAGGGIDLYARLLARHIGRHLPGRPGVTVQVMPGAGGIRAANYLAEQAPRDGSAIATFAGGPVIEPLIGARNPGYNMSQFTWLGALAKDYGLCVAWAASPFKTIGDARARPMIVAGTGVGSDTDTWPVVLNEVLGTKFKLVTGYLGTQETFLAMERGEAHGRCVISYSALKIAKPEWLRERKINVLLTRSFPSFRTRLPFSTSWQHKRIGRWLNFLPVQPRWRGRLLRPPGLPRIRLQCCAAGSTPRRMIRNSERKRQRCRPSSRPAPVKRCNNASAGSTRRHGP